MSKELITIEEFFQLTLITERDLLGLLSRGQIRTECGSGGELLIDLSSVSEAQLIQRSKENPFGIKDGELELYEEIIASEVLSAVDLLLEESLELALKWQSQPKDDPEA